MENEKRAFVMYCNWRKQIELLSDEQAGAFIKAVYAFVCDGIEPKISDPLVQMIFSIVCDTIKRDSERWEARRAANAKNGKLGGRPSKKKPTPPKPEKEPRTEAVYFPQDQELDAAFKEYIHFRKEIKKPMTERAVDLAIKKLNELSGGENDSAIKILEQSIQNGWGGLFPLPEKRKKNRADVNSLLEFAREFDRKREG